MHLEANCPKCNARLHVTDFKVGIFKDDEVMASLYISCWRCSWDTDFKIERYDMDAEED